MTIQTVIVPMMKQTICVITFFAFVRVHGVLIPFLDDVILNAIRPASLSIVLTNQTCQECLCLALNNSSLLALNCYPNSTCQFFLTYPRTYQLQPFNESRLYFLRNIFPNASNPCCVSNTTYLLDTLQNSMNANISMNVSKPRCLLLDDDGLLVTVEQVTNISSYFDRFDPTTLSFEQHTLLGAIPTNIAYYDHKYYIGFDVNYTISVYSHDVNSNSLTYITNINASPLNMSGVRDMIFLNNGQTMVVASASNKYLFFYSLINNTNYTMTSYISVNYPSPHGLHHVNDSFFYATSWGDSSIYAYNYDETMFTWSETLFVNATINKTIYGAHVTIDDCNRRWFTIYNYGIKIYDENGINLGNWSLGAGYFDTLILDNYIVILSNSLSSEIIRIDPQLECDDS